MPFPSQPNNRAIKNQLLEENEQLYKAMGAHNYRVEEWESLLPQNVRDAFAARALIACNGDGFRAAVRLGFGRLHRPEAVEIISRIFETPGVKEILARDLREPEQNRAALIERQLHIALYGDDTNSVKSFQMLAKVCGWVKTPDVLVQNTRQTILALVTQKNARGEAPEDTIDALPAFLEHEPGAAVRIDSGDELVAAALGSGQ